MDLETQPIWLIKATSPNIPSPLVWLASIATGMACNSVITGMIFGFPRARLEERLLPVSAFAMTFASVIFQMAGVQGLDFPISGDENKMICAKVLMEILQLSTMLAALSLKVSIGLTCFRVFRGSVERRFEVCCLFGVSCIATILQIFFLFYECTPMQRAWGIFSDSGDCVPGLVAVEAILIPRLMTASYDFLIALLPTVLFRQPGLSARKKGVLWFIVALGMLSALAAAFDFMFSWRLVSRLDDAQPEIDSAYALASAMIEVNFGIIAAALPCWIVVFDKIEAFVRENKSQENEHGSGSSSQSGCKESLLEKYRLEDVENGVSLEEKEKATV